MEVSSCPGRRRELTIDAHHGALAKDASDDWHPLAACRRSAYARWFTADIVPPEMRRKLSGICAGCPVKDQCADYANSTKVNAGFWAGRFRGHRIPQILRENSQFCPVNPATGKVMPLLLVSSTEGVSPDEIDKLQRLGKDGVQVAVLHAWQTPDIPDAVHLVLTTSGEVLVALDMVRESKSRVVLSRVTDDPDQPDAARTLGRSHIGGQGKDFLIQVRKVVLREGT